MIPSNDYARLESYEARLKSFEGHWDPTCIVTPEDLASNWFYYYGPQDLAKCWHCNGMIGGWLKANKTAQYLGVSFEHKYFFPRCVAHIMIPKLSVQSDEVYKSSWFLRCQTFQDWEGMMSAKEMAQAGFYYDWHDKLVRCAYCQCEFDMADISDPVADHRRFHPRCQRYITDKIVFKKPGQEFNKAYLAPDEKVKLGILPMLDAYKRFATFEARMKTYVNWKSSVPPEDMARSGFLALNYKDDRVACFSCHGVILGWDDIPGDPYFLHAMLYPRCAFIKSVIDQRERELNGDDMEADDNDECASCSKEANTVYMPCGHLKCCEECAEKANFCCECGKAIMATTKIFRS